VQSQIASYMREFGVDLVCLQETRVATLAQYVVEDVLFVTMGHGRAGETEHAGVGFAVGKSLRKAITGYRVHLPGRIVSLGLDTAPRRLTVICACIPQSGRPEEDRAGVMEELSKAVLWASRKGIVLTLGDLSARLHGRRETEEDILGPRLYGAGIAQIVEHAGGPGMGTNRDMLMDLCREHSLRVAHPWFQHGDASKVTHALPGVYRLPAGRHWDTRMFGEIDFCLVPSRWKGIVQDVRSRTRAGLPTDHFPLEVRARIKLGAATPRQTPPKRWDFGGATEEQRRGFDAAVAATLPLVGAAASVEAAWQVILHGVQAAMKEHIPPKVREPRRPWISGPTMELIARRRGLVELGQIGAATGLDKDIRRRARADRRRWIAEGLLTKFWDPIRCMTRRRAPGAIALQRPGVEAANDKPAEVYAEYLGSELWARPGEPAGATGSDGWCTTSISGEGAGVDQGCITEAEVGDAIASLAKGKAPGADEIPAEAWKLLKKSRSVRTCLANRCWEEEQFPDEWREAVVVGIFKRGLVGGGGQLPPLFPAGSGVQSFWQDYGQSFAVRVERRPTEHPVWVQERTQYVRAPVCCAQAS